MRTYTPSRHYPRLQATHNEARYAVVRELVENIKPPGTERVSGAPAPVPVGTKARPAAWLGELLATGAFGSAFKARADGAFLDHFAKLRGAMYGMYLGAPRPGSQVIVKVARPEAGETPKSFAWANFRESGVHAALCRAGCANVAGVPPGALCPAKYVPKLYASALVNVRGRASADTLRELAYVTVMDIAPGVTLNKYLERHKITADVYLRAEQALASMWAIGLVHNDAHKGNIMYDPPTGRVTVIDFGFGTFLPPALAGQVRDALSRAVATDVRSLGEIWRDRSRTPVGTGLQAYANRVIYSREVAKPDTWNDPWYNPDGGALMRMFSRLSAEDRARVPGMRRRMWGAGGAPAPGTPSPAASPRITRSRASTPRTRSGTRSGATTRTTVASRAARVARLLRTPSGKSPAQPRRSTRLAARKAWRP
jgi:hypothetical protein